MYRKIVCILVCIMLFATMVTVHEDSNVEATPGGDGEGDNGGIGLPYDFVWNTTYNLTRVVHDAYGEGEIPRGRAWATEGENYTIENILKPEMNKFLDDVQKLQLGPVENNDYEYTSKIRTIDFEFEVHNDNYQFQNPIPKKEMYIVPSGNKHWETGELTYNYSLDHELIIKRSVLGFTTFGYSFANDTLNVTYSFLNDAEIIVGSVSYISSEDPVPEDQECSVFLIDEEEGCEDKLDNISGAVGCILLHDDSRGYSAQNTTSYDFAITRINSGEENISEIKSKLENDTKMTVEQIFGENRLSFSFDFNDEGLPDSDFVYIAGIPTPYEAHIWGDFIKKLHNILILRWWYNQWNNIFDADCRAFIIYDSYDTHLMYHASRNWTIKYDIPFPALPVFSLNNTVGSWLEENRFNTSVSGYSNQEWKDQNEGTGVTSYNVVGFRNISESPDDSIVIINNRMDGWWGETPGDSGCGGAIVLGIAKYFNDYNIEPKHNLTFLMTTGEEYGYRGGYHYQHTHDDDNVIAFIALDQLAFNQLDSGLGMTYNSDTMRSVVMKIAESINYNERVEALGYPHLTHFTTEDSSGGEDAVWKEVEGCEAMCFAKDAQAVWKGYHRTGNNYEDGDSLKNTDRDDLNLTFDLAWHVVKYYTVDPDCWFEGPVIYEAVDSQNDGDDDNDSINATISISTILPHDKIMVKAQLWRYGDNYPTVSKIINYTINSSGINDVITVTLPPNEDHGYFQLKLYLYNSTGMINDLVGLEGSHYNNSVLSNITELFPRGNSVPETPLKPWGPTTVKARERNNWTTTTTDPNGDKVQYKWNWSENLQLVNDYTITGFYESGVNCTTEHMYRLAFPALRQIQVQAIDEYGLESGWSEALNVTVRPNVVIDEASAMKFYAVADLDFQLSGDEYGGEDPIQWLWSFGDGNTSSDQNTTYNYSQIGNYTVILNVTDNESNVGNTTVIIEVVNLSADFNTSYSCGAALSETIYFNDTSIGVNNITNWIWDFSDGDISYDQNTTHSFSSDGVYNVTLNVTDNQSNTSIKYINIHITSDPDPPGITYVQSSDIVSIGSETAIIAVVSETDRDLNSVKVNITLPDNTSSNFTMSHIVEDVYEYSFNDTWQNGQYNYTILAEDIENNTDSSTGHSFTTSAQATIHVQTLKDSYGSGEYINITDPPTQDEESLGTFGDIGLPVWQDITVTENEDVITVDNGDGLVWKFHKGTVGYNEIWYEGSQLVANEQWALQYLHNSQWKQRGIPQSVSYEQPEPHHVIVTRQYTDYADTEFTMSYEFYGGWQTKILFDGIVGTTDTYRIAWKTSGINTDFIEYNASANMAKIWNTGSDGFVFDYYDVYESLGDITGVAVDPSARNHKCNLYFSLGELVSGSYVVLDPYFGTAGGASYNYRDSIVNMIRGTKGSPSSDGTAMSIRFRATVSGPEEDAFIKTKCALYEFNGTGDAGGLVAETEEREILVNGTSNTSLTFNFTSGNRPWVEKSKTYFIVAWCEDIGGGYDIEMTRKRFGTYPAKSIYNSLNYSVNNGIYPDPMENESGKAQKYYIICTYSEPPVVDNPYPVNISDNISQYPTVNIAVNDNEGNDMNLTFNSNASGSWQSFGSVNLGSYNKFGYDKTGSGGGGINDVIRGTWFTCPTNGTADMIVMYVHVSGGGPGSPTYMKAALYYKSNNTLFAETEERSYGGDLGEPSWWGLQFSSPPALVAGEEYYVVLWGYGGHGFYSTSLSGFNRSISMTQTYGDWPGTLDNISYLPGITYDIYVFYNTSSTPDGTYYMDNFDVDTNATWYYWNVTVDDGYSVVDSDVYRFLTGYQSKIRNTGITSINGYLLMQVQYYNSTLEEWVVANDAINETTPRTINSSDQLALDLIFNGQVNTSDLLSEFGSGTYRIYAAFRDPDGDVLICDDETVLEAWYEFEVNTS